MIHVRTTENEIRKSVKVGELLRIQRGDIETIIAVISRFVVDDNGFPVDRDTGRAMLEDLTIDELIEVSKTFYGGARDSVVPPSSAAT